LRAIGANLEWQVPGIMNKRRDMTRTQAERIVDAERRPLLDLLQQLFTESQDWALTEGRLLKAQFGQTMQVYAVALACFMSAAVLVGIGLALLAQAGAAALRPYTGEIGGYCIIGAVFIVIGAAIIVYARARLLGAPLPHLSRDAARADK
jgi:putative superfamily III holin-X